MKPLLLLILACLPLRAQFLEPSWRGEEGSEHLEWDRFTVAKFGENRPDVAPPEGDAEASVLSSTPSAFLTSNGNIYSFQAPLFLQVDDTTPLNVRNVFLQISALGSGIDVASARLIMTDADGETVALSPTRTFVASEEDLRGERGGVGTIYGIQWDLRETPLSGSYSILFNSTESSLSLGALSLDLSESYSEIPAPRPLTISVSGQNVTLSWFGNFELESCATLAGEWVVVPESRGVSQIVLPLQGSTKFFRLKQSAATE